MKTQFLLHLADTLESLVNPETQTDVGFYLPTWICTDETVHEVDTSGHSCGTVACIGGWAVYLYCDKDIKRASKYSGNLDFMQEILGIYGQNFFSLCTPDIQNYSVVTPDTAAQVIRHFVETGEVDWGRFGHSPAYAPFEYENEEDYLDV